MNEAIYSEAVADLHRLIYEASAATYRKGHVPNRLTTPRAFEELYNRSRHTQWADLIYLTKAIQADSGQSHVDFKEALDWVVNRIEAMEESGQKLTSYRLAKLNTSFTHNFSRSTTREARAMNVKLFIITNIFSRKDV